MNDNDLETNIYVYFAKLKEDLKELKDLILSCKNTRPPPQCEERILSIQERTSILKNLIEGTDDKNVTKEFKKFSKHIDTFCTDAIDNIEHKKCTCQLNKKGKRVKCENCKALKRSKL